MTTVKEDAEHLGIFNVDPSLEQFKDHFTYRSKRYMEQKSLIEKYEGSLEEFAQGETVFLKYMQLPSTYQF